MCSWSGGCVVGAVWSVRSNSVSNSTTQSSRNSVPGHARGFRRSLLLFTPWMFVFAAAEPKPSAVGTTSCFDS